MKIKFLVLLICIISLATVCSAKQLSNAEQEYYRNLRNCTPLVVEPYEIKGFEKDQCKVVMTLKGPANSKVPATVFTYKYPRPVLNEIVRDAINLSDSKFRAKWEPRGEQFCETIKYGDKIIYSK